jgi:hypothetical protein
MKKVIGLVFLWFSSLNISAQTITGKIQGNDNQAIIFANVLIKQNDEISEFVVARNGQYKYVLKKDYSKLVIEVTANGYETFIQVIENCSKNEIYNLDFTLQKKEEVINLEEVTVKAPQKPIEVKDDTTKYNINAFKDGTERKIIDIIKKLPGIQVNDKSGEIKFKGKSIETIALEGDNLFGNNYSMGAKNINVDMVEQVQAIENYNENILLKGIENSDKVILNLKLKKGKFDFSGEINAGFGSFADKTEAVYTNNTILGVNQKYKAFGVLSYNNLGQNYSSNNYFSNSTSIERSKESTYLAKKILPEMMFSNEFADQRSNINKELTASYNNIFKIKKRTNIKFNLNFFKDNIFANQINENQNIINNQNFITSDNANFNKNPLHYQGDLEIKHHTSTTSLLEYFFKIQKENISTHARVLQNELLNFGSILTSDDLYIKQKILFTQKIASNKALQFSLLHSTNKITQDFTILPSIFSVNSFSKDIQKANTEKKYLEFLTDFLGNNKSKKYVISLKAIYDEQKLNTNLYTIENNQITLPSLSKNDVTFTQKSINNKSSYYFLWKRLKIAPSYSLSFLSQNWQENNILDQKRKDFFIFEPSLSIYYKINEISKLFYKTSYSQNSIVNDYLLTQNILISNRNAQLSEPTLFLQKTFNQLLAYNLYDLSNQYKINGSVNYRQIEGNFFSNLNIQPNFTQTNFFYLPQNLQNIALDFSVEKYVSFLESNLELTTKYTINNYKNIVNNSELRDNQSDIFEAEFSLKTALDKQINFYNTVIFNQNISQNNLNGRFKNSFFQNSLKIVYIPTDKLVFSLKNNYYIPTLEKSTKKYFFMDFEGKWSLKNIEISLILSNLLNNNNLIHIQTFDYGVSISQSRLLPRYFLFLLSYRF